MFFEYLCQGKCIIKRENITSRPIWKITINLRSIKVQTGYQICINYLQEKNRTIKFQTNFKHSPNVALKVSK